MRADLKSQISNLKYNQSVNRKGCRGTQRKTEKGKIQAPVEAFKTITQSYAEAAHW